MAKNSLCNDHGFSAYQLVFSMNQNLPSILMDKPSALEGKTYSRNVGKHVASLFEERLVVQGFEEGNPDIQKDSPTFTPESLKIILAIMAVQCSAVQ